MALAPLALAPMAWKGHNSQTETKRELSLQFLGNLTRRASNVHGSKIPCLDDRDCEAASRWQVAE